MTCAHEVKTLIERLLTIITPLPYLTDRIKQRSLYL